AWQDKRRRAAEAREPLTAAAPAWLRLVDGEWEVDQAAAAAVRQIFRWAAAGYGIGIITRKLNAEGVPAAGRAGHWARSYVAKLLCSRAVVGEYQPHKGKIGNRRPEGKPIAGYFPAIVTEGEWYAARAALASRKTKPGRLPTRGVNLFAGLL